MYCCAIDLALNKPTDMYLDYCLRYIEMLLSHKITIYLVFDGAKLPAKKDQESMRAQNRQLRFQQAMEFYHKHEIEKAKEKFASSIDVTPQLAYNLYEAVRGKPNIHCIVAPNEADAQLAYLCRSGIVDFVISEDSDLLAFGTPRVFFKMGREGWGEEIRIQDFDNNKDLALSSWTHNMFLYFCIFQGCDYLPNVAGVGAKSAHKLVQAYRNYSQIITIMKMQKGNKVCDDYQERFERAVLTFRFQKVYCPLKEKIVHLNELPLEDLEARYGTNFPITMHQEDEEEQQKWNYYENNILERSIIFQIIRKEFSWDFLGE